MRHYLEATRDGLHSDGAVRVTVRMRIHGGGEGVAQGNGGRQHLQADQEVLVPGRHCTRRGRHSVRVVDRRYHFSLLEDG